MVSHPVCTHVKIMCKQIQQIETFETQNESINISSLEKKMIQTIMLSFYLMEDIINNFPFNKTQKLLSKLNILSEHHGLISHLYFVSTDVELLHNSQDVCHKKYN